MYPAVSVVMPVRNEERHLEAAIRGVSAQDYPGDVEIICVLAPCTDKTPEVAKRLEASLGLRIIDNPEGRTPQAMNIGIAAASHDIIVRVDAHVELSAGYIEKAVQIMTDTGAANVGGRMNAVGVSPFEEAVAAGYNSRLGLGGGGFHLENTPAGPADTVFLGVFRKTALIEVGGFDEHFQRAQDWELNLRLRMAGHVVYYSPELVVTYRPRATLKSLAKQFFMTGQWRREVIRRYPATASVRYLAPPTALAGVVGGSFVGLLGLVSKQRFALLGWLVPLAYLALVFGGTVAKPKLSARARAWFPLVIATMHMCWGLGFLDPRRRP